MDEMLSAMSPNEFRERVALRLLEIEEIQDATSESKESMSAEEVDAKLEQFAKTMGF